MKLSLSKKEFTELSKNYNIIPLYKELILDLETPVTAFIKLNYPKEKYSFLLESVDKGEIQGRYSFLGANPFQIISIKNGQGKIQQLSNLGEITEQKKFNTADPLQFLQKELNQLGTAYIDQRLPKFFGGLVGYLAYDIVKYYENIPNNNSDELEIPDLFFLFTRELLLFDHIKHRIKILYNSRIKENSRNHARIYQESQEHIERIYKALLSNKVGKKFLRTDSTKSAKSKRKIASENKQDEFVAKVIAAKEYISQGDIFQVVLSNRFSFENQIEPLNLYRALRSVNPSPYLFFYKFKDNYLVGSSPEILVRKEEDIVEIRPIAGTRPRGLDEEADERLAEDLLHDEKEIAEHIMLVDLARNDIGRIARKGTVKVGKFKTIEKYSHVMHIVSSCKGSLDSYYSPSDVAKVSLPAGTLSGAPKIRAMEIIDELENLQRSYYGGSLGYFSYSGDLDLAILIRTFYLKGNKGYFQAGAGIVFDSDPEKEWQEVLNKAQAMRNAIELAQNGLDL